MKINGNDVNHLILGGQVFSAGNSGFKLTNHQNLGFGQRKNGNVYILTDNRDINNFSKYLNKKIIIFYTFTIGPGGIVANCCITVTEPFIFTGNDTVQTVTNDGEVYINYYPGKELTVNCPSQWQFTDKENACGTLLEVVDN